MEQTLLDLPLDGLKKFDREPGNLIPLVVGTQMAKKAKLKKGDSIVLKWRDRFGVIDAKDILVVDVADIVNPRVDEGVLWLRLDHLRAMTQREGEVSWVAVKNYHGPVSGVEFQTRDQLMADLLALLNQDRLNSKILWAILMILAGTISRKMAPTILALWDQMPAPKWGIAMGGCTISGGLLEP